MHMKLFIDIDDDSTRPIWTDDKQYKLPRDNTAQNKLCNEESFTKKYAYKK